MTAPVGAFAGFWSRLSPRERNLLTLLVVVFFVMGIGVLFLLRSDSFAASEERIAEMKRGIQLMQTRGAVYSEKLKEKAEREAMIASEPLEFSLILEQTTRDVLVDKSTRQEEEKPPLDLGDGLVKRVYSFELQGVTLEEMVKFLQAVENQPGHVIFTERLKVRSSSSVEDRLAKVEVDLATWEMAKEAEGGRDKEKEDEDR
ncbi:MAG: hypothetical protein H6710_08355 [Myxococcales bacterium]|nr:hypothetical protein [Myxococcales bacterium]MCB9704258.1 hypothetical protein [Myxococcales bacterium]